MKAAWAAIFHYRTKFLQDWTISQDLPRAAKASGVAMHLSRRLRRHRRACSHNIKYSPMAQRRHLRSGRDDRDLHQERKRNLTGAVQPVSIDDASLYHNAASRMARWHLSKLPATPAATKPSTHSKSTAKKLRPSGTCMTSTVSSGSITRTKAVCVAGAAFTSRTAITLI